MANKFKQPSLAEITYTYLGLHKRSTRLADYDKVQNAFVKTLTRINKPEEIRAALALDSARQLPVQMKSPAYERLLILIGRTPSLLREYAQEMYEYGPEWQEYADRLWQEAKTQDNQG